MRVFWHSHGEQLLLFFRSVFWTVLIPGMVTIYFPRLILEQRLSALAQKWSTAQYLSFLVIAAGTAVLLRCIWDFAVVGRGTLSFVDAPKKLVIVGLYRYVRNPMYIGVLLVLLGETVWFKSVPLLEYTAGWFVLVNLAVLLYEEPTLRHRFGQSYDHYCRSVHRWWPGRPFHQAGTDEHQARSFSA